MKHEISQYKPHSEHAFFLINLLQDVNILRPLIFMASRDLGFFVKILYSNKFESKDRDEKWMAELNKICSETAAILVKYDSVMQAVEWMQGKSGIIFAGSESTLPVHSMTNKVFEACPDSFLTVTLQHGYECVGFLQSKQHDIAHGTDNCFGADIVCGWLDEEKMQSMCASQKHKLYVTGPTSLLQMPTTVTEQDSTTYAPQGIICENLHSSRMNVSGDLKLGFIEQFSQFCESMSSKGKTVTLRPHPGGQYMLKHAVKLHKNVSINNDPMYKVDLKNFAYGISAPSSVLIDMVLAEIPVAVWRDSEGIMDSDNYTGLTEVHSLQDWIFFAQDAVRNRDKYLARQSKFLEKIKIVRDPSVIYRNYEALLNSVIDINQKSQSSHQEVSTRPARRILFVANGFIPTLQLSFIKPLSKLIELGEIEISLITDDYFKNSLPDATHHQKLVHIDKHMAKFNPTNVIFCRYSGPHASFIRLWAKQRGIAAIFHIDDDLLNVPLSLGMKKFEQHNSPARIKSIRYLLDHSDLVYCSTTPLMDRFKSKGITTNMVSGEIYCSAEVSVPAYKRPVTKLGYMGFDHSHDLETVLNVIERLLEEYSHLTFSMFGTIPKPKSLEKFGNRIIMIEPVRDYKLFLEKFASLGWDIGICPLVVDEFNLVKANTKWVEYTSIGAAVVATKNTVYDYCGSDDCAILAENEEEWYQGLKTLIDNPQEHHRVLSNAQSKLKQQYNVERLKDQVLSIIEKV